MSQPINCRRSAFLLLLAFPGAAVSAQSRFPQGDQDAVALSGPNSVGKQIESDRALKSALVEIDALDSYYQWKQRLVDEHGLSFGLDYTSVYLNASDSIGRDEAASGMVRFFGTWDLLNRDSKEVGTFVWKVEDRHRHTAVPASGAGIGELGYVGLLDAPFNNQGGRLTNLYWRQEFDEGRAVVLAGFLDVTDYVDASAGLSSPWLHYSNFAFSTGAAGIGLPGDAALGFSVGTLLGDDFFVHGGLVDASSDPTQPFDGLETFFDEHDFFKHVELGWKVPDGNIYTDNVHLTLWHTDGSEKGAVNDGWGVALGGSRLLDERWFPWGKLAFAEDGGALLDRSVSAGVGFKPVPTGTMEGDLIALGLNFGSPNSDTFGPGLDEQFTAELFYRMQITKELAVTPDLQLLVDPALNPGDDVIFVFGLRARIVF